MTTEQYGSLQLPTVCLGTHRIDEGNRRMEDIIQDAWDCGYSAFDTAEGYGNEQRLGIALHSLQLQREEYFLVTKLDDTNRNYDEVRAAIHRSLEYLQTDYIDLFLIHAPNSKRLKKRAREKGYTDENCWEELNREAWAVMEEYYGDGVLHGIGVSNFQVHHLESLMLTAVVKPMVNQIKMCVGSINAQNSLIRMCRENGIAIMGYSPLGKGGGLCHPEVLRLAEKYRKLPAQILLRSLVQQKIIPVVRTSDKTHMEQDLGFSDFKMEEADCEVLNSLIIDENWAMIRDPDTFLKYNREIYHGQRSVLF